MREKVLPQLYLWFRGGLRQWLAGCGDQKVPCQGQPLVHTEKNYPALIPSTPFRGPLSALSQGAGAPL